MRYRISLKKMMLFIDADEERRISRIELKGELPLLIADTRRGSATLWVLTEDLATEHQFDAHDYSHEEEDGETHTWEWYDENDDVMLRVVIYSPVDSRSEVGQVVIAVGEGNETMRSLLVFMTDFADWTLFETHCDVAASLNVCSLRLMGETETENIGN